MGSGEGSGGAGGGERARGLAQSVGALVAPQTWRPWRAQGGAAGREGGEGCRSALERANSGERWDGEERERKACPRAEVSVWPVVVDADTAVRGGIHGRGADGAGDAAAGGGKKRGIGARWGWCEGGARVARGPGRERAGIWIRGACPGAAGPVAPAGARGAEAPGRGGTSHLQMWGEFCGSPCRPPRSCPPRPRRERGEPRPEPPSSGEPRSARRGLREEGVGWCSPPPPPKRLRGECAQGRGRAQQHGGCDTLRRAPRWPVLRVSFWVVGAELWVFFAGTTTLRAERPEAATLLLPRLLDQRCAAV